MVILCTLAGTGSEGSTTRDDDGSGFDAKVFALAFGLAHIPLFTGIAVAIVIGVYCCYFKRKKGSADLAAISEKGGLVILDDKLLRAKEEGRLTVNVAILDNGKVHGRHKVTLHAHDTVICRLVYSRCNYLNLFSTVSVNLHVHVP